MNCSLLKINELVKTVNSVFSYFSVMKRKDMGIMFETKSTDGIESDYLKVIIPGRGAFRVDLFFEELDCWGRFSLNEIRGIKKRIEEYLDTREDDDIPPIQANLLRILNDVITERNKSKNCAEEGSSTVSYLQQ